MTLTIVITIVFTLMKTIFFVIITLPSASTIIIYLGLILISQSKQANRLNRDKNHHVSIDVITSGC